MFDVEINKEADEIKSLYAKNVVLTGELSVFIGARAVKMVTERSVVRQKGVTKETSYVVVGDFTSAMIKGDKSSKLVKAEKYAKEGKKIEIISEEDFLRMLQG